MKHYLEIQNFALNISLEFGKNFGKDIKSRLKQKYIDLNFEELESLQNLCEKIESECWNLIENETEKLNVAHLQEKMDEKVFNKYNWINHENRKKLLNQFSYYFWKDGLIE